jgi:aspartate carbamoyltransferase catalytic subunit
MKNDLLSLKSLSAERVSELVQKAEEIKANPERKNASEHF